MKAINNTVTEKIYSYHKGNILYKASENIVELTGYTQEDLIGKSFKELSKLLKANTNYVCKDGKYIYEGYIFTSENEPKHVRVISSRTDDDDEKVFFTQIRSSQFLKGVLSTCVNHFESSKESVAIYSYPELIHLKVNENYLAQCKLSYLCERYSIGSPFHLEEHMLNCIRERDYYYEQDIECVDNKGNHRYWTMKANLIYEEGEANYLKITFFNETEKVLIRKALESRKKEMNIILENIPDSIIKINSKGEYTYVNKSTMNEINPYITREKPLTIKDTYKLFQFNDANGEELSFYDTPACRVLRGEIIKNYPIIGTSHLPTTYHECNGTPIYDELGNVESALLIYRDIEDRFKLDEYSVLSKNIKNLEINYAKISYKDFKIEYVNDKCFESIEKIHPDIKNILQVIGINFFDLYINDDKQRGEVKAKIISSIEKNEYPYIYNQKLVEKGKVKYVKSLFQPLFNINNEVEALNFIGMYITDEELANQRMAKSLREQEEIFINTSHELKTPINLIFSAAQLLSIYLKNESIEEKRHNIEYNNQIITQNCYRSIKLINNILDISRIEQGYYQLDFKNINIVNVIDDIVASVAHYIKNKDLKIIFDSEIEEKIMAVDLYKFERIMLNLISNAIKFSKDKGIIFIHLSETECAVKISVEDQGIGIDEENIDNIFNKFKQENKSLNRRVEGTGIGLSLVKSIVELHGGAISLTSIIDVGSTFTFTLPVLLIDGCVDVQNESYAHDRVEMIKFELSDIYS